MSKLSQTTIENLYSVYYAATDEFRRIGQPGLADRLFEVYGHELTAWDAWYGDGEDPDEMPEYRPTMADLNAELRPLGYKGIGGKNPRVIKLSVEAPVVEEEPEDKAAALIEAAELAAQQARPRTDLIEPESLVAVEVKDEPTLRDLHGDLITTSYRQPASPERHEVILYRSVTAAGVMIHRQYVRTQGEGTRPEESTFRLDAEGARWNRVPFGG